MRTVTVDVDLDDVMDQIDNKDFIKEAGVRNIDLTERRVEFLDDVARQVRKGDIDGALASLEAEARPKWKGVEACRKAYEIAMGRAAS